MAASLSSQIDADKRLAALVAVLMPGHFSVCVYRSACRLTGCYYCATLVLYLCLKKMILDFNSDIVIVIRES
jgi:hypothetical protein